MGLVAAPDQEVSVSSYSKVLSWRYCSRMMGNARVEQLIAALPVGSVVKLRGTNIGYCMIAHHYDCWNPQKEEFEEVYGEVEGVNGIAWWKLSQLVAC